MKKFFLFILLIWLTSVVYADCSRYGKEWLKHGEPSNIEGHTIEVIEATTNGAFCTVSIDGENILMNRGMLIELDNYDIRMSDAIAVYGPGWEYSEEREECTFEINGTNVTLEPEESYQSGSTEVKLIKVSGKQDFCLVEVKGVLKWIELGKTASFENLAVKVIDAVKTGKELISRSNIYDTCEFEFIPKDCDPDSFVFEHEFDVIDIDWGPKPLIFGDKIDVVSVTVKNIGNKRTDHHSVYLNLQIWKNKGDHISGDYYVSWCSTSMPYVLNLEPGESGTVFFPHIKQEGYLADRIPPFEDIDPDLINYYTADFESCEPFTEFDRGPQNLAEPPSDNINTVLYKIEVKTGTRDTEDTKAYSEFMPIFESRNSNECPTGAELVDGHCREIFEECTDTDPGERLWDYGRDRLTKGTTCEGNTCYTDHTIYPDCIGCQPKLVEYYCDKVHNELREEVVDCFPGTELKEGYCLNITEDSSKSVPEVEETEEHDDNELDEEEVIIQPDVMSEEEEPLIQEDKEEPTANSKTEAKQELSAEEEKTPIAEETIQQKTEEKKQGIVSRIINWFKSIF
ncbi:MAG: hypothetical protein JXC31_05135 [Acholeplasmataceae bacterium]|nr:hypothetical protein [Acholeplasmataceae bacterium]